MDDDIIITNLEKIKENLPRTFRNFKELLNFLCPELSYNNSSEKSKIMENLERFFSYKKNGQKIIITEIFDTPKKKILSFDLLNKYLICLILKENVRRNSSETFVCNKRKLAENIGYFNENFKNFSSHRGQLSEKTKVPKTIIENFYLDIPKKYSYRLEKAVESLTKSKVILREIIYCGISYKKRELHSFSETDSYGDSTESYIGYDSNDTEFTELTDEEKLKYQQILSEEMHSFSYENKPCETLGEIYQIGKINGKFPAIDIFYKKISERIKKELGFKQIFESYKITYNKEQIYNYTQSLEGKLELSGILNKEWVEKLKEGITKSSKKKEEKIENFKRLGEEKINIYKDGIKNEKEHQEFLIDLMIDKNAEILELD